MDEPDRGVPKKQGNECETQSSWREEQFGRFAKGERRGARKGILAGGSRTGGDVQGGQ